MSEWDGAHEEMSAEELHLLKDVFQAACGFNLRDDLKFVAERRLAPRLEALGLSGFAAYHRYLRFDPRGPEEMETAIELLVPHETYFFREPMQLKSVAEELWPALAAANAAKRSLHVWSAGCSSGEEPYTLAMLLLESRLFEGWDLDVLGTDLSRRSLTTARHAEYGPSALRVVTPTQREKFFEPADGGRVRVKEAYRALVRFGQMNLLEPGAANVLPVMDVIFCRNVLIYFETETRRKVVETFFNRLRPGGHLLLGHAENLLSLGTRFELVQLEGDLVYRKPGP